MRNTTAPATYREANELQLTRIRYLIARWENDEPGDIQTAEETLTAIVETLGPSCSICRRRHGSDVTHDFE